MSTPNRAAASSRLVQAPSNLSFTPDNLRAFRKQFLGGFPKWAEPKHHAAFAAADCAFLATGEHTRAGPLPLLFFDAAFSEYRNKDARSVKGQWQQDRTALFESICDMVCCILHADLTDSC